MQNHHYANREIDVESRSLIVSLTKEILFFSIPLVPLAPCLILVIESIFFPSNNEFNFHFPPQLSSALFIASRFGFECIAIHEMPQPANRAGDRATTPSTTSLNPLSPPAERSSSPPPSLMFSRFARRLRSTIASIIDRFFLA